MSQTIKIDQLADTVMKGMEARQAGDRDPPWGCSSRLSGATRLPL